MSLFQALVLGLVQGVTEFLPISSSGFLILTPTLLGWEVQTLAFDAFVHIATLLAVIVALWSEIKAITLALLSSPKNSEFVAWRKLAVWIALSTVPILVVGFVLHAILSVDFRSTNIVAWSFIVWGVVLYLVDRYAQERDSQLLHVGLRRALMIGLAQCVALIPGTSRSGITITAGLMGGLTRETATRFSFLLAVPAIAAAGFFELGSVARGVETIQLAPLAVGFLTAMVSGFFTVRILLRYIRRYTFRELAIFRVLVGTLILLLL